MSEPRVVGDYVLGALLGHGASSEVYAAEDRLVGDAVAVKLLHSHLATDARAVAAFVAEAERTRAIDHPNVVRVLGAGRADGVLFLAMERLHGEDLGAHLARVGRLSEQEVRRLGAAIADGAQAAHDRGIVHRDLKPANVVLVGGAPKLVDFGIAKALDGGGAALATAPRIGTIAYMAPEQITGGAVTPAVDVWALGALLFECATGGLPFTDFANGRCPQLAEDAPPAHVALALDAILAACLARDPSRRPSSMRDLARLLRGQAPVPLVAAPDAISPERVTQLVGHPPPVGDPPAGDPPAGDPPAGDRRNERSFRTKRSRVIGASVALALLGAGGVAFIVARHSGAAVPDAAAVATVEDAAPLPDTAAPSVAAPPPVDAAPPPVDAPEADAATGFADGTYRVWITSRPAGATVYWHGEIVGYTPVRLRLADATPLAVRKRGFRSQRVRVDRGRPIEVRLVPEPMMPAGETLD